MGSETRVAWYGKHPAWSDYVPDSHQPASAEKLRDWIKQGRDHLARSAPKAEERGDCYYLLAPAEGDQIFCGVIGPSSDGGVPPRVFPFTLYVPLARRRYRRAYPLLPAYAAQAWEEMRAAHQRCLATRSGGEVERILNDLAPEVPAAGWGAWRRFRRDVSVVKAADFVATLHPGGQESGISLLARMAESLAPFHDGRLGPPELGFDLPVSSVLKTAAYQTAFWLRFCESALGRVSDPDFFLRPTADGRRLSLFLREPNPADYALALAGVGDQDRIHRLDGTGPPVAEALLAAAREIVGRARSVADLFTGRWDRLVRVAR
jgi:type VI secretion system ImpM family protein